MLKTIVLRHNIDRLKKELEALREKTAEFEKREEELTQAIEEAQAGTDEDRQAVEEEAEAFDRERAEHDAEIETLSGKISDLEKELETEEAKEPEARGTGSGREAREKGGIKTMINLSKEIRSLPVGARAFDAIPAEMRDAILAQQDVKEFLQELRGFKGQKRAVSGGELTIPVVLLDLIAENMYRYSKLMNRVRIRNVSGQARQTIAGTVPEAVWTEMCGNINELTFVFNQVTLDGYKVAGYIPVCNALLEDNDVNLAAWIVEMLSESVGLAKDKAILYGKGSGYNMPLGIVTRLAQTSQPAGYPAAAPAWTDLHTSNIVKIDGDSLSGAAFWSALTLAAGNTFTKYSRGDQFWAMNSKTYNYLKSKAITFTASGDIVANVFGVLPIINGDIDILEFMPDYDIVGGYGDLYLWAQRAGMTIDSSEHVQFIQDNTVFRGKERADGTPVIAGAFVAINIKNVDVTTEMLFAGDDANTVSGLLMSTATASVAAGSKITLKAIPLPFGAEAPITWTSATTAKATVNSTTGEVTGVSTGSSVITATCNGFTATCTVTVTG